MPRSLRLGLVPALLLAAVLLAGCLPPADSAPAPTDPPTSAPSNPPTNPPTTPSDGGPNSPAVPILGQSRLTASQIVDYYQSHHGTLTYRATGATLQQLADMFVTEGNRYNVRGDLAFAQAIVETGWLHYPDNGIVKPGDNNFAGIGACDSCGDGFRFDSARNGVRAQLQLLRNFADANSRAASLPDPPIPELWGLDAATAISNFDHCSCKGKAPNWNDMGNGNWASASDYATIVVSVYNEMLKSAGLA